MRWLHGNYVAHYNVAELDNIQQVKDIFVDGTDEMNWLFLSTSGVHGSYTTLDELEKFWDEPEDSENYHGHYITILVYHPRMVCSKYGDIEISREDIPWLRQMVTLTIEAIKESQVGNLKAQS